MTIDSIRSHAMRRCIVGLLTAECYLLACGKSE